MRPLELLVFYVLIGGCVAAAMVRGHVPGALVAVPLWPLFLPTLLASPAAPEVPPRSSDPRIDTTVDALGAALRAWDAAPPGLQGSVDASRRGLQALADRVRELERILPPGDRPARLDPLVALRDAARADLERGLTGVADLTARVHVARFTPTDRGELVAEQLAALAAALDGAAEVRRLG